MPGSFTTPTISATVAEGGSLTVTITPSSALGAATTVRWVIVPKGKTPISSSDFSSLTGTLSFTSGSNTAQTLTLTPTNDTVITHLGADHAVGGSGANADTVIMVLEDYTTTLVFTQFDVV
jgi:hypothetical protein